ncbi:MAG: LysR family transcriptional regulator [Pigmentiphaga sp.]|uniref:LysR family transcriptional regulator n=1 Tax=Pigmentiphaga sp. TaxID=1977564 RepID=UPI0029A17CE8|nr:LysR family transcriptional regulator [Pigmentiphaga sp.]MDX3905979.1 LysR family transcriptional regulator [Pigmentiphaga sp.]
MVTLRQLHALATLANTGSFTATANTLALTQSAVSVMIKELEQQVGVVLVERGRTVRLTAAGKTLCETANRVLADIHRTLDGIRSSGELRGGRIRVAVGPLTAATFFPRALALFRERHPLVGIEVLDVPVEQASQRLAADEADVAIGSPGTSPALATTLHTELLLRDRLYAVYARGKAPPAPAAGRRLKPQVLQKAEVILTDRVSGQWRDFFLQLSKAGVALNAVQEVKLYSTALEMVRYGLGMTLLPAFAARHLDPGHYDVRAIEHGEARWEVHWMTRAAATPTAAIRALRSATAEALATNECGKRRPAR